MTVAEAAGQLGANLNDELTIIFNWVQKAGRGLEPADPLRKRLAEISGAAQRCAWTAAELVKIGGPMRPQAASPAAAAKRIPDSAGLFHPAVIESMLRQLQQPKEKA